MTDIGLAPWSLRVPKHDGQWLRTLRHALGHTMGDVADLLGVPVTTLSRWEVDGCTKDEVARVLEVLLPREGSTP